MVETVKPKLLLQGYCDLVIGAVSSVATLKGTGCVIFMWALTDARRAAAAIIVDLKDIVKCLEEMI